MSGLMVVIVLFVLMVVLVVVVLCWFCGSVGDCCSNGGGFGDWFVVCFLVLVVGIWWRGVCVVGG